MPAAELLAYLVAAAALAVAAFALLRWRGAVHVLSIRVLIGEATRRRGVTPADAQAAGLEAEVLAAQKGLRGLPDGYLVPAVAGGGGIQNAAVVLPEPGILRSG